MNERTIAAALDRDGYALTPPLLTPAQCEEVSALFAVDEAFRSTVTMARHRSGEGSYRYFARPLPPIVADLRERLYPPLAAVANRWASRLGMPGYPLDLAGLAAMCAGAGQLRPTPLLLRYEEGGYNCLHQDLYGDVVFPLQVAILLSRPDIDGRGRSHGRWWRAQARVKGSCSRSTTARFPHDGGATAGSCCAMACRGATPGCASRSASSSTTRRDVARRAAQQRSRVRSQNRRSA